MRASRVRIRKLEQSIETFTANRRALDEMRKSQAETVAAELVKYKAYMTHEAFDEWKKNEQEYRKRLNEPGRDRIPGPGPTQQELDRAWKRVWESLSDAAKDRYNKRHYEFQAVYKPRYIVKALRAMAKNSTWGGLGDQMKLIGSVQMEVEQELGFNSWGERIPYDLTEHRSRCDC